MYTAQVQPEILVSGRHQRRSLCYHSLSPDKSPSLLIRPPPPRLGKRRPSMDIVISNGGARRRKFSAMRQWHFKMKLRYFIRAPSSTRTSPTKIQAWNRLHKPNPHRLRLSRNHAEPQSLDFRDNARHPFFREAHPPLGLVHRFTPTFCERNTLH